nr:hypothetical protein [Tanacetum cinerariifolium]
MVAILEKGEFNSDFHPMVDFIAASPLRIKTTDEGTHILSTVDGIQRTVSESSLRCNLKLRDEDGIVFIADTELFENLTLMGPKSTRFNEFSSNIATALVCLATNRTYNFSKMIFDGMVKNINNKTSKFLMIVPLFDTMLIHQGEGSGTPTEPHHTPFPEAETSHPTTSSIPLPSIPSALIPPVTQHDPTPIRQYTKRARIAQSSALPTIADEPASPVRDISEGKACPTESGFIADQDRATIAKSYTLPYDSAPRITSPAADEGNDAPIKGRSINEGEAAAERISNDSEDVARVLTSMDATTVLAWGIDVPTGSGFIPTTGPPTTVISTGSEVGPTASPTVTRRKGKEVMVESDTQKKKKLQEQIDAQVARELAKKQEEENMRMNEQITRDAEVARIHVEEELQGIIDSLDKSNETIAKYLQEYQDFASSQQKRPMTKKQTREYYMAVIRSNLRWRVKDFKGMTFEEIEAKFAKEITEEKMKELMQLVPVEDVYVQSLQVKHPIINWKVHTKGQRSYWQIIRLGGSSACYQFFVDLLKQLDREDLNQLWDLVKEYLSIRPATSDKEMELWVELKRMYEPDPEDQLWTLT